MTAELIAVVGPTGTGKTELSLDLAERLGGAGKAEILNADAMQLYRGMNIGTAKLPQSERRGIAHHLFDVLDVTEESTVAAYQPLARQQADDVISEGRTPILAGGSGLYVSSVLYEFDFPGTDASLRERLEREAATEGIDSLFAQLVERDPVGAQTVDRQNPRRVIRALEIVELTGKPMSIGLPSEPTAWRSANIIGLKDERGALTERLDRRVEAMWQRGLLEEVEVLRARGIEQGVTASRAIGYAQALAQLTGDLSEAEAIEQTQALTRRYARRQMSWFKRYPGIRWFQAGASDLADRALDLADPGDGLEA